MTRYKDGKFTAFRINDGLSTNEFYCVLCDDQGDLWMSSPRGIVYLTRKNMTIIKREKLRHYLLELM